MEGKGNDCWKMDGGMKKKSKTGKAVRKPTLFENLSIVQQIKMTLKNRKNIILCDILLDDKILYYHNPSAKFCFVP